MMKVKTDTRDYLKEVRIKKDPVSEAKVGNRVNVAVNIADAIDMRGLTKLQFAELMGRDENVIADWLEGQTNFDIDTLSEIGFKLGVDFFPLLFEEQLKQKSATKQQEAFVEAF